MERRREAMMLLLLRCLLGWKQVCVIRKFSVKRQRAGWGEDEASWLGKDRAHSGGRGPKGG